MKKRIYFVFVVFILAFIITQVPTLVQAQGAGGATQPPGAGNPGCTLAASPKFGDLLSYATCIISTGVIPLIFAVAVATFVWGIVQYVINTTDEKKRTEGKMLMIWGIIALTVMISIWGLVHIAGNTFNLNTQFLPQVQP